jgi:hypothetical protein
MQAIPLQAVPSQTLQFVVAGQNCQMSVYSLDGYDYTDPTLQTPLRWIAMDFAYNGIQVTNTQNCLNYARILRNRQYLGFVGDFMFVDTQAPQGTSGVDPKWEGLNTRWVLLYLEATDLPVQT